MGSKLNNRIKSFLISTTFLHIVFIFIIMLFLVPDFYILYKKEKKSFQTELNYVNQRTVKLLEKDFSKISAYLNVCDNIKKVKCNGFYKPILSLLPEFILISTSPQQNKVKVNLFIESNIEFISINHGIYRAIIKIENLKNKINSSIPEYIQYSLYNKNRIFFNKKDKRQVHEITNHTRSYHLLNHELLIDYWIDEQYINSRISLLVVSFIKSLSMLSLAILVLYFILYRQIKYRLYGELTSSLEKVSAEKQKNEDKASFNSEKVFLLEQFHIIDKKITKIFCNHIFICNEGNVNEDKIIQELNFREKIIIQDNTQSSFNIKEIINEIKIYYADYLKSNNIELHIESTLEYIEIKLAKESFYQIIFSLVENKLRLLSSGDKLQVNIIQKQSELIFSMEDTGFLLSPKKMQEYAKKISEKSNLFFLSWDEVISLLVRYQYRYKIESKNKNNYLQIKFLIETHHSNQNKVCYLENYRS